MQKTLGKIASNSAYVWRNVDPTHAEISVNFNN